MKRLIIFILFTTVQMFAHSVTLNWTPVPNADHYTIYRTTTPGTGYAPLGTVVAPPFTDLNVAHCSTYYYAVSSLAGTLESAKSPDLKVLIDTPTDPCSAPGNPTNMKGSAQ